MFPQILSLQQVGFHRPGSLRLLTTPGRVDEARYQLQRQGWHQSPMNFLSPEKVQEMLPIMNCSDVLGGLFTPGMLSVFIICILRDLCI